MRSLPWGTGWWLLREMMESVVGTEPVSGQMVRMPILLLHVHSRCNCRCSMCDIWKRDEGGELDLAELERQRQSLIDLGVEQVVFTGGEPLMHRQLGALIRFFRDLGIKLTLLSSGLLLERYADLVIAGFDDVIVSLDGPASIHDRIRGVKGAYECLVRGVGAVKQRIPGFSVKARCTVQQANFGALAETVDAAVTAGLDGISFLAADLSSTAFNRELVWPVERRNAVEVSAAALELLEVQLDLVALKRETLQPYFIVAESREKLQKIANHFRAEAGLIPHRAPLCNAPWVSAVWEVDGTLRPCFFHKPIGNTKDATLGQVLNGSRALEFRNGLQVEENSICKRCVCSLNYNPG